MGREPLPLQKTRLAHARTAFVSVVLLRLLILSVALSTGLRSESVSVATLLGRAAAAEANLDTATALDLYLAADTTQPNDADILQKIARQYSDSIVDQPDPAAKKRYAEQALAFSQRAVELAPDNAVNVLSVAVARGKLAAFCDTKTKVAYSHLIKADAERALALDPAYAWAHHVLGRWHLEVASLGKVSHWFAGLVYGQLPSASLDEAVRHLQRATELEPSALAHHLELGFASRAVGRDADARRQFEIGLQMPSREKHDELAKQRARSALHDLG